MNLDLKVMTTTLYLCSVNTIDYGTNTVSLRALKFLVMPTAVGFEKKQYHFKSAIRDIYGH